MSERVKQRNDQYLSTKVPVLTVGYHGKKSGIQQGLFVLQRHNASHLHWDFRLEYESVMKSWAIPKGLSKVMGVKRLAVPTEDHDMEWASFEGRIPKGLYGAGVVSIADRGKYDIIEWSDDFIKINLHGKEFKGIYDMRKIKKDWIIWKTK